MTYKREIPKLNRDNFKTWQELMKLHLMILSHTSCHYLENDYKALATAMSAKQMKEHKNHNIMMVDIAPALSYTKFDEIKGCKTTHEMWVMLEKIFGGDDNVKRAKEEILRGQFDQMGMKEDENISHYDSRIKASFSAISASRGIT